MRSIIVSVLVIAGAVFAQSDRGTITGTVSDPAGALLPNAPIQAKNTATGVVYDGGDVHDRQLHHRPVAGRQLRSFDLRARFQEVHAGRPDGPGGANAAYRRQP